MPEIVAVVAVVVVAMIAWVGAWMHARDPANLNPHEERARLQHQAAWLEQRLHTARRERWDDAMAAGIAHELAATRRALAAAVPRGGAEM